MYGALAVAGTMGPWYLLLLLGHCVSLYVASLLGQPWLCLGLGMVSLASFKLDPLISWQVRNREGQEWRGCRDRTPNLSFIQSPHLPSHPKLFLHVPSCLQAFELGVCLAYKVIASTRAGVCLAHSLLYAQHLTSAGPEQPASTGPGEGRDRPRRGPWGKLGGLPTDKGHLVSWRPVLSHPERVCNGHF